MATESDSIKREWSNTWAGAFLAALEAHGCVADAAKDAGVYRTTPYDYRAANAEFAAAWKTAIDNFVDRLEREAYRRAALAAEEDRSDTLLIFVLKAKRPLEYRDNAEQLALARENAERLSRIEEALHAITHGDAAIADRFRAEIMRMALPSIQSNGHSNGHAPAG